MTQEGKTKDMMKQLRRLGFGKDIKTQLEFPVHAQMNSFNISYWKKFGTDAVRFCLPFTKDSDNGRYYLQPYQASLIKDFAIPDLMINGVSTKDLENRMKNVDWTIDHYLDAQYNFPEGSQQGKLQAEILTGTIRDLRHIRDESPMGGQVTAMLMFKFWTTTPFEMQTPAVKAIEATYETQQVIQQGLKTNVNQTYQLLSSKLLNNQKTNFMNEKILADLKNTLKYMGFGDKLNAQLENEMAKGGPNFQLRLETEINNKAFAAVLNFKKSDTTDRYFFNSYHATLGRKDGEVVDQAFYLKDGKGITAKEAFNLLDGRAVHKELTNKEDVPYKAWVQIDFDKRDKNNNHEMKQFHENYGYDLKGAVEKFAVKELDGGEKEKALLGSLMKGNVQAVNIEAPGAAAVKMFMEANPQFKSVTLYDEGMKRVPKEELEKYHGQSNNVAPAEKQSVKQDVTGGNTSKSEGMEWSQGKDQKIEKKISDGEGKKSLLPKTKPSNGLMDKKRVSKSKGQHIT